MIIITSIDPEALRGRSESDHYHVLKDLAKVMRQHGVLHLTGPQDEKQLHAAVAGLDQAVREIWEATLISLGSLDRIKTDDGHVTTHESCMASPIMAAILRPSDLVVLSDRACGIQAVPDPPGCLQRYDEPEIASVPAVNTCNTVDRVEALVLHPHTEQGQSRELTWTNHMQPLARLADREVEVRVLDRYLFTTFFDRGSVKYLGHVDWLLAKLNECLPPDVKVHLIAQDIVRGKGEPSQSWELRRQSRRQLREWLSSQAFTRDRPDALRVSLSPWRKDLDEEGREKGKPHDRHIRFNTWVALATPQGFDRLQDEYVSGEDGMVLNRVMAMNDEGRDDYFTSLLRKEEAVLKNARWLLPDAFQSFARTHAIGQVVTGRVVRLMRSGAFVRVAEGIEGLVNVSELSWKHIDHPQEVVEVGQEVTVELLDVDMDRELVSLSLKATQEEPWQRFARTHAIGQVVLGRVTELVPFGVFVRVAEGVEGLVHISELAARHVEIPEQIVTVGDEISVKVIDIDLGRRRISLSLKQAIEDAGAETTDAFDPFLFGMPASYDENGAYILPEGFDPVSGEWKVGCEDQRTEWEQQYREAYQRWLQRGSEPGGSPGR